MLATPVSPELLPPDENGNIKQKTEDKLGPYEVHDFYLYYFLRFGTKPQKLLFMASRAFLVSIQRSSSKSGSGFLSKDFS